MIDGLKERIAVLLSNNVRPAQIARALSVSPSYISDLLANDDKFKSYLGELVAKGLEHNVVVEANYDIVEKNALSAMVNLIPGSDMRELTMALETVNKHRTRQGAGLAGGGASDGGGGMSVTVTLPQHTMAAIKVETNERNEIVKVGDKGMLSLTAAQFSSSLRERETTGGISHEQASNRTRQEISQRFAEIERVTGGDILDIDPRDCDNV